MDGDGRLSHEHARDALCSASVSINDPHAIENLKADLGGGPHALVLLFCSPSGAFDRIAADASRAFSGAHVVACTTAGEITHAGYAEGTIVAVAFPASAFAAQPVLVEDLDNLNADALIGRMILTRAELQSAHATFPHQFAFLLVDGLSLKEDKLVSCLPSGLGHVPLFGGSAGDGTRFKETLLALDGRIYRNAAILTFVRTLCPVHVFSLDHLNPTDVRMVVTRADPARRVVSEINAEPAAAEYARLVGKDPAQLSPFTFAAHPVVVQLGGRHHVRSIQQVTPTGELVFFSAIDEGVVLRVAEPKDMTRHLTGALDALKSTASPTSILACDCILRRLEAGESKKTRALSQIMSDNNVIGFSTYGEQFAGMHVNQTMTGVAIYPPGSEVEP